MSKSKDDDIASSVELREGTELDYTLTSESWYKTVWKRFSKSLAAKYSFYFLAVVLIMSFIYPILVPFNPKSTQSVYQSKLGGGSNMYTSLRHPMGTDLIGRDILSMILGGAQTSMMVGIGSTIIFLMIGVPLGLLAGYYQGRIEEIIMRITDFFLALPFLIIAIITVRVLTLKYADISEVSIVPFVIMLVLGVFGWGGTTRLVTATTKQTVETEYVAAAKSMGASDFRIMTKHIFPNVLAPIIVVGTLGVGFGILSEAGITFLGLGNLTDVSWGNMINLSQEYLLLHPQQALIPGFTIFGIVLSINLMGDTLRDALDPKLKD